MSLSLITNPVVANYRVFAGFRPIEFKFKREDLAHTGVSSGLDSNCEIAVSTDLTAYLSVGDTIYLYSEGATTHIYSESATITAIDTSSITVDIPYIESGEEGYINYLKNYYVEMQCVDKTFTTAKVLPFSLYSDSTASGGVTFDVSIVNDLNEQRNERGKRIANESGVEFVVKYREVYDNTPQSWTTLSSKLVIALYASDVPEQDVILNSLDEPHIYEGYPAYLAICHAGGSDSDELELRYTELNINKIGVAVGTLGTINSGENGFFLWEVDKDTAFDSSARYINFKFDFEGTFDFRDGDFAYPDFVTQ